MALDDINVKRDINFKVHSNVLFDEQGKPKAESQTTMIDAYTYGFCGEVRVIVPFETPCYDCMVHLHE